MTAKQNLRKQILENLKKISPHQRQLAARAAIDQLTAAETWKKSQSILAYMALPTEMDTAELFFTAWQAQKSVFIPQISGKRIIFRQINTPNEVVTGPYGIKEPLPQARYWDIHTCPGQTLILVPGLAFDLKGNRLGRGGGYYDRFLAQIKKISLPYIYGYCFEQQIVQSVPTEPWEQKVDGLLTESQCTHVTWSLSAVPVCESIPYY